MSLVLHDCLQVLQMFVQVNNNLVLRECLQIPQAFQRVIGLVLREAYQIHEYPNRL